MKSFSEVLRLWVLMAVGREMPRKEVVENFSGSLATIGR